jgi:beta-N-acetylglucosaminidase
MNKKVKDNWLLITICLVMIVFVITFVFSEVITQDEEVEQDYYQTTFSEAAEQQISGNTTDLKYDNGYLVEASEDDIRRAMDIDARHLFEFLPLDETVNLSKEEVDHLLEGRGILEDQSEAFIEAQERYNINILYLISHAQVETGNGSSELAEGISPENSDEIYYNFFGIGAFDTEAVEAGSSYAVEEEWDSPEAAIAGGANFISSSYLENDQKTLYEIRWNPDNPGVHQYATDISWSESIAEIMEGHYKNAGIDPPDIERKYYKGSNAE